VITPNHCACCGRSRGDGRSDRNWRYPYVAVPGLAREVRIAYCPGCWTELRAIAGNAEASHG